MKLKCYSILVLLSILFLTGCTTKEDKTDNSTPTPSMNESNASVTPVPNNSDSNADETLSLSGEEFTVGLLPAESAIPIILAKEKGFFEEEGISVALQVFSSPNDRNVAVQAKELDAVIGDVMTEATFRENGITMKITSDISEDFKILSSPDSGILEMKDFSGKSISLVPNFILEYIMDEFAAEYNFSYEIIEIPSFAGRSEALMSNQIDGVVFTEPQAGMLVAQGAHLLGSSKEAGIKGGTLLFTDQMITDKPGDIKAFYRGYNKAIDYMNQTEVSEYSSILTDYQFPEAIGNYLSSRTDDFPYAGTIAQDQFDRIISWTKDKGQISKSYTYEELTDFSFLK
ncbi:MAG: metal transporter substrate-binding protein [Herbinix sp.]|jgi:NitT/TauT family transport system substrate-binding protein|nr:metal transporter substrate-binding protein [Herbinix sp.]